MFTTLLIANRGEIACRIIKTARRLGIRTIAIYSSADKQAHHVMLADEAWYVGDAPSQQSYLNIDAIMHVARQSGAEAIHPGYGFLSENAHFASACEKAGIVFVGPSVDAMNVMASKQLAKQRLEKASVPLTPGYHGLDQSDEKLFSEAQRIGFPVLLKAAMGGGGKGMRSVDSKDEFHQALLGARREAQAYFADEAMLIEKLVLNPRHVEIQIMADNHGNIVHLFERDCSIQRRHQKVIEEAPAPDLPTKLRVAIADAAIAVARAIEYRGAGTVEFLVENNQDFYFMEMNTRLQVEHPVTEMITGLDLVEWQLRIAANELLPCEQAHIKAEGHAIECRIYAEDPEHGFIPSIGQLLTLEEPNMDGIRIDSGVVCHDSICQYYDPMFAKLIAWGKTRDEAIGRMQHALKHYHVYGVKTNIAFLQAIIEHSAFITTKLSTNFLKEFAIEPKKAPLELVLMLAAGCDYVSQQSHNDPILADAFGWQMHLKTQWIRHYDAMGQSTMVTITPITSTSFKLSINNTTHMLKVSRDSRHIMIENGVQMTRRRIAPLASGHYVIYMHEGPVVVESRHHTLTSFNSSHSAEQSLTAPMSASVVAILKEQGDMVQKGESIMILEAMKMEHTIHAPHDGRLTDLFYAVGSQVKEGVLLASIEQAERLDKASS